MANVLSIITYPVFPARLGGQKGIALFNQYFSKRQQLYCYTIMDNDPSYASYPVFNLMERSKVRYINPFNFGRLKKIIKENQITHIICEHPYYGWMALWLKYSCGLKVIVHSHNIESERFRTIGKWWWKLLWYYEKWVHNHADFTFCITPEDREYFRSIYKVPLERSAVITYGIPWNQIPSAQERLAAKTQLLKENGLPEGTHLFLFNGTLDYGPNLNAVKNILEYINPLFIKKNLPYRIIICGKDLPAEMNELKEYAAKHILFAGFVEDISLYFKGADVFITPVTDGGGIKTKLVEALGYNLNAVSTVNGATGIEEKNCNGKLLLTPDGDWEDFASKMELALQIDQEIPKAYFDHFYWENIALSASSVIDDLS